MAANVTQHMNKTQGTEHVLPRLKCAGKTAHKALVPVDIRGDDGSTDRDYPWSVDHQIVQCLGCKTISFRQASSNSEDIEPVGPGEFEYFVNESLFPSRIAGRKGMGDQAHYLPARLRLR